MALYSGIWPHQSSKWGCFKAATDCLGVGGGGGVEGVLRVMGAAKVQGGGGDKVAVREILTGQGTGRSCGWEWESQGWKMK